MRKEGIDRRFLLTSARAAELAARTAAEVPERIDLVVTSPTALARQAVPVAVGDRWVFTVEEPLLGPRVRGETGGDVIARVAQALRGVPAYDSSAPLVICDSLDILGASVFVLDEDGVARAADGLEALLPLP
jgi:hypothetical protein